MTLTEFLLARIAEDEAAARGESYLPMIDSPVQERFTAARVLAECEAKRRIVERCRPINRTLLLDAPDSARAVWDVVDTLNRATLRDLAHAYADHPDYDDSWRP